MPNAYVRTRPFSDALITRAVSRMTAVVPVMSPLAAESQLTPGQENYLLSLQCGAGQQQTAAMLP